MDELLHHLSKTDTVLDLGAGSGSFSYAATQAQVIAVDQAFPSHAQPCRSRIVAGSRAIPLKDASVDMVICNNTLEHFDNLDDTLAEVDRVLKEGGDLWASVPNGFSFDDNLYRFIFEGGGHVNRFTLDSFLETIESRTHLRATRYKKLHSGFVYLSPPDPLKVPHYPRRAQFLAWIPVSLLRSAVRWINYLVRVIDRYRGSNLSQYGWQVSFRRENSSLRSQQTEVEQLERIPADIHVCFACGTAHPLQSLLPHLHRFLFWKVYDCHRCGEENLFFGMTTRQRRELKGSSLEEVARQIFGPDDPESVRDWVKFWKEGCRRQVQVLEPFQRLALVDFPGKRVLDIGCGTGGLGELIGDQCDLYVGGDYHLHVLQFAQSRPGRRYVQCSGVKLSFPAASFDYIFALDVLEHLVGGKPWQVQFLQELHRVLRPLGMIFFTTPNRLYPYEGHAGLYFPQYLPRVLSDRYITWRNPGFLKEHNSFAEIRSLGPGGLKHCLRKSGLVFLHELPCGLDRVDFLRQSPLRGTLAYLGLGWYPHAEFWGILVRKEMREKLRRKLRKTWYYEQAEPSPTGVREFGPEIDFDRGLFNPQLGPGWFWYEKEGRGYRWTSREALCYLETRRKAPYLRLQGYSPRQNHLEVRVNGLLVGEHPIANGSEFRLLYLIPLRETSDQMLDVSIRCSQTFRPEDPRDQRDLGVIIFSVGVSDRL